MSDKLSEIILAVSGIVAIYAVVIGIILFIGRNSVTGIDVTPTTSDNSVQGLNNFDLVNVKEGDTFVYNASTSEFVNRQVMQPDSSELTTADLTTADASIVVTATGHRNGDLAYCTITAQNTGGDDWLDFVARVPPEWYPGEEAVGSNGVNQAGNWERCFLFRDGRVQVDSPGSLTAGDTVTMTFMYSTSRVQTIFE